MHGDRLTVGSVLGTGAGLYARHLPRVLLLTVLCYLPLAAWLVVTQAGGGATDADAIERAEAAWQWARLWSLLLDVPLAAMLIYLVVRALHGEHATAYECLATGVRRAVPALVIMVLIGLVALMLAIVILGPVAEGGPALAAVILPTYVAILLVLYARWYVVIPASVVERPGILRAFARSATLTAGRRWSLAAVVVISYAVEVGVIVVCWLVLLPDFDSAEPAHRAATRAALPTFMVTQVVASILFASVRAVLSATAYVQLRRDKDGVDPAQLAEVFG